MPLLDRTPTRRVLILGGGFGGTYAALELEKILARDGSGAFEVTLVTRANFYGLPGVEECALTVKSLGDAVALRSRLITHLEEASSECAAGERHPLLSFVVAGGGFAGVETLGGINDFMREALRFYPTLS